MKKTIQFIILTILCSSQVLSTQIEDDTNISTTLELAIEQDSLALVALYNSTDGDNWTNNTNWLSDSSLSTWYGITLDDNGRVSEIQLFKNRLNGTIPSETGNLKELRSLILDDNNLTSTIPKEIGNLTNLEILYLRKNKLSGVLLKEIGDLKNLISLDLSKNVLSGSIPLEINSMTNLEVLNLNYNNFDGNLPLELFQLKRLKYLNLSDNKLTGTIPSEIGNLTSIEEIYLGFNSLGGNIPVEIGDLINLRKLYMEYNRLSGHIPYQFGDLLALEELCLTNTHLSGIIPKDIFRLVNLKFLHLNGNLLTGTIPSELGNLRNLRLLNLNFNQFTGSIPESILNLTNLQKFSIWRNKIESGLDNIPSHQIAVVQLHDNKFDFGDFYKANINAKTYEYSPQDSLGENELVILEEGEQYTLSSANEHVDGNVYIWFKDGEEVPSETSHDLVISDAQKGDEGIYTCSVTNEIAPELTLYRRPITLTFDKTASVNPYVKITDEFKIFPNPAINQVTIEFNNSQSMDRIQILDLLGREVLSLDVSNESLINIDISQFTNGYYNIIITSDDKNYHQSLFINR